MRQLQSLRILLRFNSFSFNFFWFTKVIFYFPQQQIVSNSLETIRSIHGVFYEIRKKSYLEVRAELFFILCFLLL